MKSKKSRLGLVALVGAAISAPQPGMGAEFVEGEILVRYKENAVVAKSTQAMSVMGIESIEELPVVKRLRKVKVKKGKRQQDVIKALKASGLVEYAEPNYIYRTTMGRRSSPVDPAVRPAPANERNAPDPIIPYGISKIQAPEAWRITKGKKSVLVQVIDTGIDYNHPDLISRIYRNPGETGLDSRGRDKATNGVDDDGNGFIDDVVGYDFVNYDPLPYDDGGHGTHCAGTVAASFNNGRDVMGVAPEVSITGCKFLGANGSGTTDAAIRCIDYGIALGVDVMSNSWGGGGYSRALEDAIKRALDNNILFVVAAGNAGQNMDSRPGYPASYKLPNVISVAATDSSDQLASFSNYGKNSVHIAAPGVNTVSLAPGGGRATMSGTSMACPHVAGAAALLFGHLSKPTVEQVRKLLLDHGDDVAGLKSVTTTGKRLNIFRSISAAAN